MQRFQIEDIVIDLKLNQFTEEKKLWIEIERKKKARERVEIGKKIECEVFNTYVGPFDAIVKLIADQKINN